jgi:hypothetical protein
MHLPGRILTIQVPPLGTGTVNRQNCIDNLAQGMPAFALIVKELFYNFSLGVGQFAIRFVNVWIAW